VTVAALLLFTVGWIPVFRYRSEHVTTKLAAASPAERRWIPLTATAITLHVSLAQLFLTLSLPSITGAIASADVLGADTRANIAEGRIVVGMLVFSVGLAWWFWARRSLGPLDRFVDTVNPPRVLLVTGPFAVVRHPLALGTLLCALGPAIAAGAGATWVTFAGSAVCLAQRCLQDEELLWRVFGNAYGDYAARTRRLVPFVW
jgi:protein-S-isoprenylcysteine O-methyltransferase Ste14